VRVRYRRHPELRVAALEDEGVVLHLGTRRYFTVSESGLALLEALAAPRTVHELIAFLLDRYDLTADRAAATVNQFLDRCRGAELLATEDEA
jgi:coenzyme PQQ synthesis protein D (PqqD)